MILIGVLDQTFVDTLICSRSGHAQWNYPTPNILGKHGLPSGQN